MFYQITTSKRRAGDRTGEVYTLSNSRSVGMAEIWPDHGFNCLRWQIPGIDEPMDCLFSMSDWETNPVPTRSGIPILFPFPNRIRDGKFRFRGKEYQLPKNDSTKSNAIHGYAPRKPWRVVAQSCDNISAALTGEFQASVDAPDTLGYWPSDYILQVTYRLMSNKLRIESLVKNPGHDLLPFGLGFHPYFRFPMAGMLEDIAGYRVTAHAGSLWELEDSLPTGNQIPIPSEINFNQPKFLGQVAMDAVYGQLPGGGTKTDETLITRARIEHVNYSGTLRISTSPDFREMLLFTPAHRKGFCVEPYTCTTDAVNLNEKGIDAGWRVLPPGETWKGIIEVAWDNDATGVWKGPGTR